MGVTPVEFQPGLWPEKTRVPGLLWRAICMILSLAIVQYQLVADGGTGRQTDTCSRYRDSIASRGKMTDVG